MPLGEAGQQPLQRCLDQVSEVPGGSSSSNRRGSSGCTILSAGSPAIIPGPQDTDISWLFKGNSGMSCQPKLLPGALQIYSVEDAITFPFVDGRSTGKSRLVPPTWVPPVRNLRTSSFFLKHSRHCERFPLS